MTGDLDNLYKRMTDRLTHLRRERVEHGEILAFYAKVLAAQRQAQKETVLPAIELQKDRVKLKVEEGFALMDRESLPVDKDCTERLFRRLCKLSLDENPLLAGAAKVLLEAVDSGDLDSAQLTTAVMQDDGDAIEGLATKLEAAVPAVWALAKLSLLPSLLATAAAVARQAALDDWHRGYCPICGALPAIAALVGEEGRRRALCSFCGHFWQLPRIGCPFCNTADHKDLRYFYGEGEDMYRVQVCDGCRGYLKVVDTREAGDADALAVEDVATGHLDLLAEEQGYQRKAPRLWGI